jgi:signal transduction histidine kinase
MALAKITLQGNPEAIPFLIASLISLSIATLAWRRGSVPGSLALVVMMLGEAGWASLEAAELLIVELPIKRLCFALRAGAAVATILGLFAFVLRHAGRASWLSDGRFAALCVPALLPLAFAWASPRSTLYWARLDSRTFEQSYGTFQIAVPTYGPLFWIHLGYCYALLAMVAAILADAVRHSRGVFRAQASIMLFGVLLPWAVNFVDMSQLFGFIHVDTVALAFAVTGVAMLPAFSRYRLLDLLPVAHREVIRGMIDPVLVLDHRGRIAELNPEAEALARRSPGAALGLDAPSAFSHWPALAELLREVDRLDGALIELDGPPDDLGRRFEARSSRLLDRRTTGRVLVLRDIAERLRAEAERAARVEAEAADRAKEAFLAVLSHELRNPLAPILAGVDGMLDDPSTPSSSRPTLEMIRRNAALEARLIEDLLDMTRVRRGRLHLNPEVVDAHAVIRHALEVCEPDLRCRSLALEVDLSAEDHHVEFDPARLQQVAWNLIRNALKFTPDGGAVTVRTRLRTPALPDAPARLAFEVVDSGIGIDPDLLPRVFEAFEQGDAEAARRSGGLGLGLAICRALVDAQGGRICASSPGRGLGSTFRVELATVPVPAPPAPGPPSSPPGPVERPPVRVLLVEDNADTRSIVSRMLRKAGFEVETAGDLSSAIALARSAPVRVLVTDIGLPDGSGLDLLRALRDGEHPPIAGITMSGFGSDLDLIKSRQAGFARHLTKPIRLDDLTRAILQAARG